MKWFLILMLSVMVGLGATSYTEFYCDASVSANNTNVNAGSTTGGPVYGPSVNGNWDGTSVFTPTDGSTPASTVSAGMWASVYLDAATVAVYIALVTNVAAGANGAITIDRAVFSGTPPASGATGRTIRVGGCWKGPHGTEAFPFGFIATNAVSSANVFPRVNFKNAANYAITAAMTHSLAGPITFQGYTSSVDDGGKAIIDGGSPGTSFGLLTVSGQNVEMTDFIFANNGTSSGTASGLSWGGSQGILRRVVAHNIFRSGFFTTAAQLYLIECEAYACNAANTAQHGGFNVNGSGPILIRCISHDNSTANSSGYAIVSAATLYRCIADSNGGDGAGGAVALGARFINCDFYNNGGAGIDITLTSACEIYAENCTFFSNTGCGITNAASIRGGMIINCAFGSGTKANGTAATFNMGVIKDIGSITYAANALPYVDAPNGDFRIASGSALKSAGVGAFTETQASYSGTVAFPDVGAGQTTSTNSSGGGSWTFSQ